MITQSKLSIQNPHLFEIREGSQLWQGADQLWYPLLWQRKAGCGPTVASHLMWYLSRTRPELGGLCPYDGSRREGFQLLMQDLWHFVTPGLMGANNTSFVSMGAIRYGKGLGLPLKARVLDIRGSPGERPPLPVALDFLSAAFADDLPVAFLNLSSGDVKNLDSWHWVTLVGLDSENAAATMVDQRVKQEIDLGLWLATTAKGGGFVAVEPAQ